MHGLLIRPRLIVAAIVLAAVIALTPFAAAQETAPSPVADGASATAGIFDPAGNQVGTATLTTTEEGVEVTVDIDGLTEGVYGMHIHEVGICDATSEDPFDSAGDHFNPHGAPHGDEVLATPGATPDAESAHAGDLGNIEVSADGTGSKTLTTNLFSLEAGAMDSLNDQDGSAIVIHSNPDDLVTDPSGNSGDRMACGVIFGALGTPEAASSPVA